MNHNVSKRTFGQGRPVKIQVSLRIRAVWSESSLDAFWKALDTKFLHADKMDSDQIAQRRRLTLVFVGRTYQKVRLFTLPLVW